MIMQNQISIDFTLSPAREPYNDLCVSTPCLNPKPEPTPLTSIYKPTSLKVFPPPETASLLHKPRISICEPSDFDLYHNSNGKLRPPSIEFNRRKSSLASIHSAIVSGTIIFYHRLSDVLASTCVVLPLVVGFWRGIWVIMDYYSAEYYVDPWASMVIGLIIPFSFHMWQQPLREQVHPDKMNFTCFYIVSRFLLLLHSFGSVNQWRGLWVFFDQYTGLTFESAMTTMIGGIVVGMACKVFCNNLAVPLYIGVDDVNNVHDCQLRFKSSPDKKMRYFWDVVWSVIVVQSLVIAAWRGLWTLADLYLYPEQPILSALITIGIGYGLTLTLCVFQPLYYQYINNLKGFSRLVVFDIVTLFGYFATVLSWRGLWNLFGVVIAFEDVPLGGEWLTTAIGTVGCLLLGCISTVVIRGASVDGDDVEDGGAATDWSISYVSLIRKRNHRVPFPEPWLFRYFCTSQGMLPKERLRRMSEVGIHGLRRASVFLAGMTHHHRNPEIHIEVVEEESESGNEQDFAQTQEQKEEYAERYADIKQIPGPETDII